MNPKGIGIAILFLVYSIGLIVAGYSYAQKGKGDAVLASLKVDKVEVEKAKAETRVITKQVVKYVDRIKTVVDKSGCSDSSASPVVSDSLFQIYRATAGHKTD